MTAAGDQSSTFVEAAEAALRREAASLRATSRAFPSACPDGAFSYASLADVAAAQAEALTGFAPAGPFDHRHVNALLAGEHALRREADGWREIAEIAASDDWRDEFERQAAESERLAGGVQELQQQLVKRDRPAEQEVER